MKEVFGKEDAFKNYEVLEKEEAFKNDKVLEKEEAFENDEVLEKEELFKNPPPSIHFKVPFFKAFLSLARIPYPRDGSQPRTTVISRKTSPAYPTPRAQMTYLHAVVP